MKSILTSMLLAMGLLLGFSGTLIAQQEPDAITGEWLNANQDRRIQFLKANDGSYYARISWLKSARDPEYKPGQVVIKDLVFKDGSYKDGKAYSPENGGWVKCTAKLKDHQTLAVTGHKYFLSKTRVYTRFK